MKKTRSCIWIGTRRRSTSRLSRVAGLAGVSGYAYRIGLPAAPFIGLRGLALKHKGIYADACPITRLCICTSVLQLFLSCFSIEQHLLDPCGCCYSVWKQLLESIYHRLRGNLEENADISYKSDQRKPFPTDRNKLSLTEMKES